MGERKGQNKYYPPDYDPRAGGLNKWQGVHALRERGRKSHLGIIIIRFEMPYNIWCTGCNNHIGMGVRYNAEKKKVGMYYTTPVYEFDMKCHLCDNHFIIRTDPGNLDYAILSGARRQENRWDPLENSQVVPETKETQRRLFDDPMYKLEHGTADQRAGSSAAPQLARLFKRNEDTWTDTYTANQILRKEFRKKSNELKEAASIDRHLLSRSSLNIPLLKESEEDRQMAKVLSRKRIGNPTIHKIGSGNVVTIAQQKKAIRLLEFDNRNASELVRIRKQSHAAEENECTATIGSPLNRSLVGDYHGGSSDSSD